MPSSKSNFLDKVLGRIGRLDQQGLQTVVQRLARERRFLETLFNTIEDGILVLDERAKVLYFNNAATQLLGLQPSAEGQSVRRLLPELDWDRLFAADRVGGTRLVRHELEISFPRPRFLSLYVAPLDGEQSGSSGIALIVHDVTEARQKTFQAIESERMQALTLLAASVAHEIGNPLHALYIHLQLMERELKKFRRWGEAPGGVEPNPPAIAAAGDTVAQGEFTERMDKYLGVAKQEITRLDYIITQFLQAIRPAPPKLELAGVNEIVRATIELLEPELQNRGITVNERFARDLPPVPIDPSQIKQVLVNLCKNALQAMTRGGVLTLQTEPATEGVWLIVGDTGGGISPELLSRIFQPFYTTKKKGSGLGLMIVQRIIRDHGGRIELESNVGKGTTFRIWLPLHERPPRLLTAGATEPATESGD